MKWSEMSGGTGTLGGSACFPGLPAWGLQSEWAASLPGGSGEGCAGPGGPRGQGACCSGSAGQGRGWELKGCEGTSREPRAQAHRTGSPSPVLAQLCQCSYETKTQGTVTMASWGSFLDRT